MSRFHWLASAALFATASIVPALATAASTPTPLASDVTSQLPRTATPLRYDLTITPDPTAMTFSGSVAIDLAILAPTTSITLNASQLEFASVELVDAAGRQLGHPSVTSDAKAQTATFTFDRAIGGGQYTLKIGYRGKIQTHTSGLFALDYRSVDGKPKRALFTQFENSDARTLLPCWDEPSYKAVFSLTAIVPDDQMAVSNMPIASRLAAATGRVVTRFADTPVMSSYLLFLGIGDFERVSRRVAGVDVGVVTERGMLPQAGFALDAATEILPWYNAYFGTPFPLPKLDNVAGPGQSQTFGAMENWGAIFSFERDFLLDPATASQHQREGIFITAAHEMAHQWFGDLVTMRWWDDLWLNEGFASWMQEEAAKHFHPEWHHELDAVAFRDQAMEQDALATTHPIVQKLSTVEQASEAFDLITYLKGMAVIRMLQASVGDVRWQAGIARYIAQHAHSNTATEDLWRELDASAGPRIGQIAHDFTRQPGVPLIEADATCVGNATLVTLTQKEYSEDRPDKLALHWHVPVVVAPQGGRPVDTVVDGQATIRLAGCGPIVVNYGQNGYFRTHYAPAMFAQLVRRFGDLAPIDQLGVLSDAAALGMSGHQPASDALQLVAHLAPAAPARVTESAVGIWSNQFDYAEGDAQLQQDLLRFARQRFTPSLDRLGWVPRAEDTANDARLRTSLIAKLGQAGEPEVVAEAQRRFDQSRTDPTAIPPALRRTVLTIVARHADQATWDRLHAMARLAKSTTERQALYSYLALAYDPKLADEALALTLTDEPGATTGPNIIRSVALVDPDKAVAFVLAHEQKIMAALDSLSASTFVANLASGSHQPAMIDTMERYAAEHGRAQGATRPSEEAIASIKNRIRIRTERMPAVRAWLEQTGFG